MVIDAGPEVVTETQQIGLARRRQGLEACEETWRPLRYISMGQDCLSGLLALVPWLNQPC